MKKYVFFLAIPFLLFTSCSAPKDPIEARIDELLSSMTIDQKIGQLSLRGTSSRSKGLSEELKEAIRKGSVGAILNLTDTALVMEIQRIAVNESPQHIPLLFGRDVIHGYKTIFPIPLALASSWNPSLATLSSQVAANEAYSRCINWTFAPMVDICRDPRWGRVAESSGEDPYLASAFSEAYVKGFQGDTLSKPGNILACAKHFAAYGAAEGGRDYNTVSMSEQLLRDVYLKPYQATVKANVATFMTSFNDINGVPASGNPFLLKKVLRDEWNFKGFVVSDWNSITEMIPHGFCKDEKEAALKAASAGLDMEMTSMAYTNHLKELIEEGKISEQEIDKLVRNILRIKLQAGLFENPYFKQKESFQLLSSTNLALAKTAAVKSCVLLKNKNSILPISTTQKIAVIGPMADAAKEQLGTWIFDGDKKNSKTPLTSLQETFGKNIVYAPGLTYSRDKSKSGFVEAIEAAKNSDVILFFGGEEAILSGEAHSRADIRLPGIQEELILELAKTKKPIVLILMSGRPITLEAVLPSISSLLVAWHPGTMAGPAITDLLIGKENPSGKLPITWPKTVGQIPIYYNHTNTGRPADKNSFVPIDSIPIEAWQSSLGNTSHYLDAGFTPLFPFGFGLSYTNFSIETISLNDTTYKIGDSIIVTVEVQNIGNVSGIETVQLYLKDHTASMVRPIQELKAFQQVELNPNEKRKIQFVVSTNQLGFYNSANVYTTETGTFSVLVGNNAKDVIAKEFELN